MTGVVAVLIHGAGHTAAVWQDAQAALAAPSVAVDLPSRGRHAADITRVTVEEAARSVVADLHDQADLDDLPIVLVGHSVSGTILPSIAARLNGRVNRLVFVAGITAPEGHTEPVRPPSPPHEPAHLGLRTVPLGYPIWMGYITTCGVVPHPIWMAVRGYPDWIGPMATSRVVDCRNQMGSTRRPRTPGVEARCGSL